jgi:hypothetical protein
MHRFLFVLVWAMMIFIFTCTARMEDIFESLSIVFQWNPSPNLEELFLPLPAEMNPSFMFRKIGHGFCFFILTMLLGKVIPNLFHTFLISCFYASTTEIFQLYFNRDGRLFDIGFDTIGIIAAIILLSIQPKQISLTRKSQT